MVGTLPESLNNLSALQDMFLHTNKFEGVIPSLNRLTQLEFFDVSNNNLVGSISPDVGNLTSLIEFNVSHNQLGNLYSLRVDALLC